MSISLCNVNDEWSTLKAVILGTAESWGPNPNTEQAVDPKSREHIIAGTYPTESAVHGELSTLVALLESEGIEVLRPHVVENLNQVFSRDVGVVITNKFIRTSMIADRAPEWNGIAPLLSDLQQRDILTPPTEVRVEGGDVMPMKGEIWVGYSDSEDFDNYKTARTNEAALNWLSEEFPHHFVRGFALSKSDTDPRLNALHLDCCLSVLGGGHAIFHPEGLKYKSDRQWIRERFEGKLLEVDSESMYHMQCNLFSISPNTIVSGEGFNSVNAHLKAWGYRVLTTPMNETSKMEGLLRCVTLPIIRS